MKSRNLYNINTPNISIKCNYGVHVFLRCLQAKFDVNVGLNTQLTPTDGFKPSTAPIDVEQTLFLRHNGRVLNINVLKSRNSGVANNAHAPSLGKLRLS